jgi:hypothetical protein
MPGTALRRRVQSSQASSKTRGFGADFFGGISLSVVDQPATASHRALRGRPDRSGRYGEQRRRRQSGPGCPIQNVLVIKVTAKNEVIGQIAAEGRSGGRPSGFRRGNGRSSSWRNRSRQWRLRRENSGLVTNAEVRGRAKSRRKSSMIRPGRALITSKRSARNSASSMSWVTNTTVVRMRVQMSSNSSCMFIAGQRIERAKGFVHQQQAWAIDQHAGDFHPLLHAAGKLIRASVRRSHRGRPAQEFRQQRDGVQLCRCHAFSGRKQRCHATVRHGNSV